MPLYEYKCSACARRLEVLQKHDDPAPVCDDCVKEMTRQVSVSSFSLRGHGWARDGYGLKGDG